MEKLNHGSKFVGLLQILALAATIALLTFCAATPIAAETPPPTPSAQAATGPGGSDYKYNDVSASTYGTGASQYWLFEPASPVPGSAPVVVFNHGFLGMDPTAYLGWIRHLVRQGNIVIFPVYQDYLTSPADFTANAIAAVKNALLTLQAGGHVTPDVSRYALLGHSAGGVICINMAARALAAGLPLPKAMMLVEASDGKNLVENDLLSADFAGVPASTLLLAVAGADDGLAGRDFSERAIRNTSIPANNKNLVIVHSDDHGSPKLTADHLAPLSPVTTGDPLTDGVMKLIGAGTDALDYYGFWKLADGLLETAFGNEAMRKYALGDTPEQRFMGLWSDGTPVKEMEIVPVTAASSAEPQPPGILDWITSTLFDGIIQGIWG